MFQQNTLVAALYQSKWLINEHIYEVSYFMYVACEGNYNNLISMDAIIMQIGNDDIHMSSRYVVKYNPCMSLEGTIKRDTVGCKYRSEDCAHTVFPDRFLRRSMKEVFNYLYCEGYSLNPNIDYEYHRRTLAVRYQTIVSQHLIKQIISAVSILYLSNEVLAECLCNFADDCMCESIVKYFSQKIHW
jgi:hypothetical protein